ncbi:FAD binding domain-containing protein [Pullulanibacillus sp. KACC 23026]|uniref:FAD binding domain-containing protein n=1 Tax=Pullulanibacillus sp. KACC 23026 TaxID=3028315 RepID=UPI0023AF6630|nr:FAD binding domain-containing protein [Pullulanibacillus sp. KACC 23026]WEG12878.1 FAD binding domain-containing protein [Pullulanibacillus sp. KACC 23026]
MLPFNFDYFKPKTYQEAVNLYRRFKEQNRTPYYISGGTELLTLGRLDQDYAEVVIDLKGISDYQSIAFSEDYLVIGAGASLTDIVESDAFPLLSQTAGDIADRTARNKITIGGNICGQFFYREAVLPLLLTECYVGVVSETGITYSPIHPLFNGHMMLQEGSFICSLLIDRSYLTLPHISIKRRMQWDMGYPLVTVAALKTDEGIRMAFSGVCPFPFRSDEMESRLNDTQLPIEERVEQALTYLPSPVLNDVEGSSDYRLFVLKNTMFDAIQAIEGSALE